MHRVPPLTANVNMACFNCFKEEKDKVSLQRCSRCRRVSYCGASTFGFDNVLRLTTNKQYSLSEGKLGNAQGVL